METNFKKHYENCPFCYNEDTELKEIWIDEDRNFADRTWKPWVDSVKLRYCFCCNGKWEVPQPTKENIEKFNKFKKTII